LRFPRKAADRYAVLRKTAIDKSGANTAALDVHDAGHDADLEARQGKFLNSIVGRDHRASRRMTRSMLGFKSFWSAAITMAGIGIMHCIREGRLRFTAKPCSAQQFCFLAG